MTERFHLFDLHVHTYFSDALYNFDDILRALIKNNIKIVGFADHIHPGAICRHKEKGRHWPNYGLVNNFSADQLRYRMEYFNILNKRYPEIEILTGAEIDMWPNGALTVPKGITPDDFDYLQVAKHHTVPKQLNFLYKKKPELEKWMWKHNPRLKLNKEMWKLGLQENFKRYHPDVFAHPGDGMPKHLSYSEIKWLILTAKKYNVALELNAFYSRQSRYIGETMITLGKKYEIKWSLGSDFHGYKARRKGLEYELNHSQEMYELAQEHQLELIDPRIFVERKNHTVKLI